MRRASLRREHPHADPDDIERLLREWLATRPGAEHGDAVGTPRALEPPGERARVRAGRAPDATGAPRRQGRRRRRTGRLRAHGTALHSRRGRVRGGGRRRSRRSPWCARCRPTAIASWRWWSRRSAARIATVRLAPPRAVDRGQSCSISCSPRRGSSAKSSAQPDEMELFDAIRAPIATVSSLIALKVLSRDDALRPQDRVDLDGPRSDSPQAADIAETTSAAGPHRRSRLRSGTRTWLRTLDDLIAELDLRTRACRST